MTFHRTHDCGCKSDPQQILDSLISASETTGLPPAQLIAAASIGTGPLAGKVSAIAENLTDGDILIARNPFDENDPHMEIIGLSVSAEVAETYNGPMEFDAYRMDPDWLAPLLTQAAKAAIPGAVGSLLNGAAGSVSSLITDPTLPVRNTLNTAQTAIQTASQGIDLGVKIYNIGSAVRRSLNGLKFSAKSMELRSEYEAPNSGYHTDVWRFELRCQYERGGSDYATYPFQIQVEHDCYSIRKAVVTALSPTVGYLSHELTIDFSPARSPKNNSIPLSGQISVMGQWDPADMLGRIQEGFSGAITVHANGKVDLHNMRSDLVRPYGLRHLGGPWRNRCASAYDRFRQPLSRPVPQRPAGTYRPPAASIRDPLNGKHIFFGSGRSNSTGEIRALVQQWWGTLRPNLQSMIANGQIAVRVTGHADPTGSESGNRALSHRRASLVGGLVQAQTGNNARVHIAGLGSSEARRAGLPSGRSDPNWRRVTISLDNGNSLR